MTFEIAELEIVELSDRSLTYNVLIKTGPFRTLRMLCDSYKSAMMIIEAVVNGAVGVEVID